MGNFSDRILETGFYHGIAAQNRYDPTYTFQEEVGRPAKAHSFRWYPNMKSNQGVEIEYAKKWLLAWWAYNNRLNLPERTNPEDYAEESVEDRAVGWFWGGEVGVGGKADEFIDNPHDMTLEGGESRVPANMAAAPKGARELLFGGEFQGVRGEGYVGKAADATNLEAKIESGPLLTDLMQMLEVDIKTVEGDNDTKMNTEPKKWRLFRQELKVDSGEEFGLRILPFMDDKPMSPDDIIIASNRALHEGRRKGMVDIPAGLAAHELISNFVEENFNSAESGFSSASEFIEHGFEVTQQEIKAKLAGVVSTRNLGTVTFTELTTIAERLSRKFQTGNVTLKTKGLAGETLRRQKAGVEQYNFTAHTKEGMAILTVRKQGETISVVPTYLSTGNGGPLIRQIMRANFSSISYNNFMKTINSIMEAGIFTYHGRDMLMNYVGQGEIKKSYGRSIATRVSTITPNALAKKLRMMIDGTLKALSDKITIAGQTQRNAGGPFSQWIRNADKRGKSASWRGAKAVSSGWNNFLDELGGGAVATAPVDYIDPPRGGGFSGYDSNSEPPIKLRPFIWLHGAGVPQATAARKKGR